MIIERVREEVHSTCQKPENFFGPQFYDQHLCVVARYASNLASMLLADTEIVELSALLHDIAAIRDFKTLPQHPQAGAQAAEELLGRLGYPADRIQRVKQCILTHSMPLVQGKGTLEEVCISNADAISQIVKPAYWLYYVFNVRKFSFKEGFDWLCTRVDTNWNALIPEARNMINDEYTTVKKMLAYSK